MNPVPGIPPRTAQLVDQFYKSHPTNHAVGSRSDVTPDGRVTIQCGRSEGAFLDAPNSWASISTDGRQTFFFRKDNARIEDCALAPDGGVAYVIVDRRDPYGYGSDELWQVPQKGTAWRHSAAKIADVSDVRAMHVSPDGKDLEMATPQGLQTWHRGTKWETVTTRVTAPADLDLDNFAYLSDGSTVLVPHRYQRERCLYVVTPGSAQAIRVPLRDLDPQAWKQRVFDACDFVNEKNFQGFASNCDWLIDDGGNPIESAHRVSPAGDQVAVATPEKNGLSVRLVDLETGMAGPPAQAGARVWNVNLEWRPDGSAVLLKQYGRRDIGLRVPLDLMPFPRKDEFSAEEAAAFLGGRHGKSGGGKVIQQGDSVIVGGVKIPVRKDKS